MGLLMAGLTAAQEHVSFPTSDGGLIYADLYGNGERGVVLAHGAVFDKTSWAKQARVLQEAGFRVLAFDFRKAPYPELYLDVLAAVRYLHASGAKTVAVVGGSMGGGAAAAASVAAAPGEIDRLVLLAPAPIAEPQKLKGRKLFLSSRGDQRAEQIRQEYAKAPEPKDLIFLDGSAHAQHIFATEQGDRLMREILRFLSEP